MDKIILRDIGVTACHGVYAEEKTEPQPFVIDLTLFLDLHPAAVSGKLADTVDYGALCRRVREFVKMNSFDLLETLAEELARLVFSADGRIEGVRVRVEKSAARLDGGTFPAAVEIERSREGTS
ncbi:MAG: dihydroneopterin aldolase [Firmicutes bacterium]|nr:dihydroneopterin aldolase [Bacillota bacterium]